MFVVFLVCVGISGRSSPAKNVVLIQLAGFCASVGMA